jgi:hypothetical protein
LNGKPQIGEGPCWKFAWSETKDRLYSVSKRLATVASASKGRHFLPRLRFQQCKFLLLFNQLPRSCHDLGQNRLWQIFCAYLAGEKWRGTLLVTTSIGGMVTQRQWTPAYSMFG